MLYDEGGQPNDLWRSFVSSVSLFDFTQPNVNTARMTTLAALGNYDETNVKTITDYLGGLGSYSKQGPPISGARRTWPGWWERRRPRRGLARRCAASASTSRCTKDRRLSA